MAIFCTYKQFIFYRAKSQYFAPLKEYIILLWEIAIICTYDDNLLHGILCRINVVTETIAQIV
jgi:hypothetical protein